MNKAIEQKILFTGATAEELFDIFVNPEKHSLDSHQMASKNDIDFTYTTLDKIFRLSIGETADFSGARYNGDFSLSLRIPLLLLHAPTGIHKLIQFLLPLPL